VGSSLAAVAAVALRYSGLEHKVNKAIEEKVAWTPDPEITQAGDLMEHDKLDEAAAILNELWQPNLTR
jgi:lipopolysaccharide/colanic/teichoic acid biosynthesis glycosyltransferase